MNYLEQFPCYDYKVLDSFSFQSIQPVSVTLPYDKALSGKMIKKQVDKTKGDLIAFSFELTKTPNVNDGDVLMVDLIDGQSTVTVLASFQQVYKGHRVMSYICQKEL
ncbi:hypothetical protein [Enterobacter sp. RD4-1-1]|uniref:hypothetical protein n=1 Tax=Enterobacter sp. RD4-1-1 TaxID=2986135 RepID=UPI0021E83D51|nr:hypothetical protein [Enterobacter sp. RD4-1-1]MCV3770314.1 hypothetical protein [Enterobacter sp. RD4-1-1]